MSSLRGEPQWMTTTLEIPASLAMSTTSDMSALTPRIGCEASSSFSLKLRIESPVTNVSTPWPMASVRDSPLHRTGRVRCRYPYRSGTLARLGKARHEGTCTAVAFQPFPSTTAPELMSDTSTFMPGRGSVPPLPTCPWWLMWCSRRATTSERKAPSLPKRRSTNSTVEADQRF